MIATLLILCFLAVGIIAFFLFPVLFVIRHADSVRWARAKAAQHREDLRQAEIRKNQNLRR